MTQKNPAEQGMTDLAQAVTRGDTPAVKAMCGALLELGIPIKVILEEGLRKGMEGISRRFDTLEASLPEIIFAAESMVEGIRVVTESLSEEQKKGFRKGVVVIGTVKGDIHDLGKTIVATMLSGAGFEVHDLGVDVPSEAFVERASQVGADIIALSCLMTTTLLRLREVVEDLDRLGLRDRFKILTGGGAVARSWSEEIGAAGYGEDAAEAVEVALRLMENRHS
jgi:5-methyltetrahydrofolate--homocysteine methyltransferase